MKKDGMNGVPQNCCCRCCFFIWQQALKVVQTFESRPCCKCLKSKRLNQLQKSPPVIVRWKIFQLKCGLESSSFFMLIRGKGRPLQKCGVQSFIEVLGMPGCFVTKIATLSLHLIYMILRTSPLSTPSPKKYFSPLPHFGSAR